MGRRPQRSLRSHAPVLAGIALVLVAAAPAAARTPGACEADAQKLCKGIEPGAGRIFACLREHASSLSPECQQTLKEIRQGATKRRWLMRSSAWAQPCADDIRSLCKDIPAGAGRIAECLKQHEAALSAPCKAAFAPTPAQ